MRFLSASSTLVAMMCVTKASAAADCTAAQVSSTETAWNAEKIVKGTCCTLVNHDLSCHSSYFFV